MSPPTSSRAGRGCLGSTVNLNLWRTEASMRKVVSLATASPRHLRRPVEKGTSQGSWEALLAHTITFPKIEA